MGKLKKSICVLLIVIITCFSGCVEKKNSVNVISQNKNCLVYDIGVLQSDLSKLDAGSSRFKDLGKAIFQGLVCENISNSQNQINIQYMLAKSCDISADGLVYNFTLRDGIKWSDGSEITAQDFCDFFKGLLDLNYNSVYRNELKCIYGASDYLNGRKSFSEVAITATNNILQIRLNYPCSYFLKMLSQPIYYIRKIDNNTMNWQKNYKNLLCSGSYKISKISSDGDITLEKNVNYIFKDKVMSSKLVLAQSKEKSAYSLADFETLNNIDIFLEPPSSEVKRLINKKEAKSFNIFSVQGLFFNFNSNTAVSNVNFRNAINLSLDRKTLINENIGISGNENPSYLPSGINTTLSEKMFSNTSSAIMAYNYFKNSGYSKSQIIKIAYIDSDNNKKICQSIIDMINKNLGNGAALSKDTTSGSLSKIKFQLDGYGIKKFESAIKNNSYDIYFGNYSINYNDSMAFLEMWESNSPYNLYGYKSSNYDNLLYEGNISKDLNKKNAYYNKCIEEIAKDMPVIPLYSKNTIVCCKSYVKGAYIDCFGNIDLDNLYILTTTN